MKSLIQQLILFLALSFLFLLIGSCSKYTGYSYSTSTTQNGLLEAHETERGPPGDARK